MSGSNAAHEKRSNKIRPRSGQKTQPDMALLSNCQDEIASSRHPFVTMLEGSYSQVTLKIIDACLHFSPKGIFVLLMAAPLTSWSQFG
jgi:hypothetical protein